MSLQNIFETILGMSLTGCFCICVALVLRPFLVRLPRIYAYILWLVIFIRLLVPVLPESRLSLIPSSLSAVTLTESSIKTASDITTDIPAGYAPGYSTEQDTEDFTLSPASNESAVSSGAKINTTANDISNKTFSIDKILDFAPWIWGIGFAGLLLFHLFRFLRLHQLTRQAERCDKNIYRIKDIPSSFVFGILRPGIYISADMEESSVPYVLCHEKIHIKRRDYLIKPLCFFILCLHWFNPLVWLAFYLCSQDMEMSCDEQTIQTMGIDEKTRYSDALLQAATDKGSIRRPYPAFSSNEVKKRIKNVLQYKKRPVILIGIATLVLVVLSVGLLMNPFHNDEKSGDAYAIGKHVTISKEDIENAKNQYISAGYDSEEAAVKAVQIIMEREVMYYAAIQNGFDVTDKEVRAYLEELKEMMETADNKEDIMDIISQYDSEEEYWNMEFEVYKKVLPIIHYQDQMQSDYYKAYASSKDLDWYSYYESYKQDLIAAEEFEILSNDYDITASENESENDQPYVFPITPESEEWKNLSMQEMLDACQIPEDKLKSMTTKALLETVLNYPFINDYFAFNTYEIACNTMSSRFNGFDALFSRDNVTSVLLDRYVVSHVVTKDEIDFVDSAAFFEPTTIEFLIVCDQIKNGEYADQESIRLKSIHNRIQFERNQAGIYSDNSDIILDFNAGNME